MKITQRIIKWIAQRYIDLVFASVALALLSGYVIIALHEVESGKKHFNDCVKVCWKTYQASDEAKECLSDCIDKTQIYLEKWK